jgi:hypothetical protein
LIWPVGAPLGFACAVFLVEFVPRGSVRHLGILFLGIMLLNALALPSA